VNIAVGGPSLERATLNDSASPNQQPSAAPAAEPASTAPAISSAPAASQSGQSAVSPSSSEAKKGAYVAPAPLPTQEGPRGLRFDYNEGCRIAAPEGEAPWRIRLCDIETGNFLYETTIKAGRVTSAKRYFVAIRIEVWQNDVSVFQHDYSARDRDVLIQFPVGTLGDTVGWLPYAVKFGERHQCRLTCAMSEKLIPLFCDAYPDIAFLTQEEVKPERYYATYGLGLFFDDKANVLQPCDFRHVGLHKTAGYTSNEDSTP
jgi:autotransporter strand-loop-strand O-heptosyltransferase